MKKVVILFVVYKQIMIDKVRQRIQLWDPQKIQIDENKNPYLNKLTIKVLPNKFLKMNQFISPFSSTENIILSQSLPIWSLIWNQTIRKSYNLTSFGPTIQYKIYENWKLKNRSIFCNNIVTTTELEKKIQLPKSPVILSFFHSCYFETLKEKYHSLGAGVQYKNFSATTTTRLDHDYNVQLSFEKKILNNLFVRVRSNTNDGQIGYSTLDTRLGYFWSYQTALWCKAEYEMERRQTSLGIELERYINKLGCLVASIEHCDGRSIFYLGFKCASFNFVFPFFATQSPVPVLLATGLFLLGYAFKKKAKIQPSQAESKKTVEQRGDQIKLITEKANDLYLKEERQENGLVIEEAYVGEEHLLRKFLAEENRGIKVNRDAEYRDKVYDVTITLRFYVQKSMLNLPKGSKLSLLGFFLHREEDQNNIIYIRYKKSKQEKEAFIMEYDSIHL